MNKIKKELMLKEYIQYYVSGKFESSSTKIDPSNAN